VQCVGSQTRAGLQTALTQWRVATDVIANIDFGHRAFDVPAPIQSSAAFEFAMGGADTHSRSTLRRKFRVNADPNVGK
jgi:hypothetical protein